MSFNEFLEREARNSESTRQVYQIALYSWANANDSKSIDDLVVQIKENKIDVYDSLDRFVSYLIKHEKAPKTITSYVAGVRAFLSF